MWSAVIAPSPNASASFGVSASVLDRSVVLAAWPSDVFAALAMVFSGNESSWPSCATRPACCASHQAWTSRTATRPDSIRSAHAAGVRTHRRDGSDPLDDSRDLHTDNHREGVSHS